MYPVDAIKVRSYNLCFLTFHMKVNLTDLFICGKDSDADHKPHPVSNVHWYRECRGTNFLDRGRQVIVEGDCQCGLGGRYAYHRVKADNGCIIDSSNGGSGPAHAVYFSTYEFVKQRLGGNEGIEHHPFAVGEIMVPYLLD